MRKSLFILAISLLFPLFSCAQESFESLKNKAQNGDLEAQYILGVRYFDGEGVAQDKKQALFWWRKAADQGLPEAQYSIGACYYNGNGVGQDKKQAVNWYRKAADQGIAVAQLILGNCYKNGEGACVSV